MGMSNELNGNNCYINSNGITIGGNDCETLLLQTSHQNISLIRQPSHEWTQIESVNIDMNPLIINTNDLNASETQQQILLVSSPMDLITTEPIVKPSTVSLVLSDLPLITSATQLNVIQVPTNLLLTDNLIVIPQEGITLEVPTIETTIALSPNESQTTIGNGLNYQNKTWFNAELMAQGMNGQWNSNQSGDQMALVTLSDCIALNSMNKSDNNTVDCYSTLDGKNQNNFFNTNQLIGIIDDQSNEAKLITSIDANCNSDYDLNAFLASSLSSAVEECDANEAKQWHNDSLIAYRAMLALKKVTPNNSISTRNANSVQTK